MIEHVSARIADESVYRIGPAGEAVISANGMIAYVATRISEQKVGGVRSTNQNVIGADLMID
jgi:hypothetical protein